MELAVTSNPQVSRLESEEDFRLWDDLLKGCFPVPAGGSFFDDFPVWRHASADLCFRLGIRGGGHALLASAACRLAEMSLQGGRQVTVALIGGVATRAEARGKGYASQLLRLCLEWARNRGAEAAFLWSGSVELYERLGFQTFGEQLRVPLDSFLLSVVPSGSEIRGGLTPVIEKELIERRRGGLLLRRRDLSWVRAHRGIDWQGLYRGRELLAFAAIGKGIDLPFCVHEWGGQREHLLGLLAELGARDPRRQLLISPAQLQSLGFASAAGLVEPLVLACAFDEKPHALQTFRADPSFWFWGLDSC